MINIAAEQAVLGGLLINPESIADVVGILSSNDFFEARHKNYFKAIEALFDSGKPVDAITICDWISDTGVAPDVGYLFEISSTTPSAANVASYAKAVRDDSQERSMLDKCNDIVNILHGPGSTVEKMDSVSQVVSSFSVDDSGSLRDASVIMRSAIDEWEKRASREGSLMGYSTGFRDLDKRTSGLQGPDLIIIAASSGRGKTTLAMNMAEAVAVHQKKPVLVFSLEMSGEQIIDRMTAAVGDIPLNLIRDGSLFKTEHQYKVTPAASKIKQSRLYVDDRGGLSISQIQATSRKFFREHGEGMIVVDYIGLVRSQGATKEERVANVSGSLKALAKELKIPVVALCQTNRSATGRSDKRPQASDLRDSAAIEHDADWIIMLYEDAENNEGVMEAITVKLRNGEVGTDYLRKRLDINRFIDQDIGYQPQEEQPKQGTSFNYNSFKSRSAK